MAKTALLAGSTGLIGSQLLGLLLTDDHYASVTAISRKPLSVTSPKLINLVCELHDLSNHRDQLKVDDVFCCLGTIIKKAKTKEAFRAVDLDAPVLLSKISKALGAQQFLLISSLGANKNSTIFYNQVKGEVEEAIRLEGLDTLHILRPSLLLGPRCRKNEWVKMQQSFFIGCSGFSFQKEIQSHRIKNGSQCAMCQFGSAPGSLVFLFMNRIRSALLDEPVIFSARNGLCRDDWKRSNALSHVHGKSH